MYVSLVNQLVVGGRCFLLLPDLSIGTIEAHSLGINSIQYTYEATRSGYERQMADHCHFLALLVHPRSHRHKS